jgi:hypothetical protein
VWWATSRPEYFNHFSATSSEKVFFGPSAFRSLEDFSRIKLVTKNDLAPRWGYCWGSASSLKVIQEETPSEDQHISKYSAKVYAEATIQEASA